METETEKPQFIYSEPDTRHLARPGRAPVTITEYSASADESGATVITWRLQPVIGAAIEYETSTTATRGNRLAALLSGVAYPITDAARLDPDWLIGLNFIAEIAWHRDDAGATKVTVNPTGEGDNPRPYAWEEAPAPYPRKTEPAPMCQKVV